MAHIALELVRSGKQSTSAFEQLRPSGHISPRKTIASGPPAGVGCAKTHSGLVHFAPYLQSGTCSCAFFGFGVDFLGGFPFTAAGLCPLTDLPFPSE